MKKLIKILFLLFCTFVFGAEEITYAGSSETERKTAYVGKKSQKTEEVNYQEISICDFDVLIAQQELPKFLSLPIQGFCSSNKTGLRSQINLQSEHQLYMLFQHFIVYF